MGPHLRFFCVCPVISLRLVSSSSSRFSSSAVSPWNCTPLLLPCCFFAMLPGRCQQLHPSRPPIPPSVFHHLSFSLHFVIKLSQSVYAARFILVLFRRCRAAWTVVELCLLLSKMACNKNSLHQHDSVALVFCGLRLLAKFHMRSREKSLDRDPVIQSRSLQRDSSSSLSLCSYHLQTSPFLFVQLFVQLQLSLVCSRQD